MKVETKKLKKALAILKYGADLNDDTYQSNYFIFEDGYGYSYNDWMSIKVPFDFDFPDSVAIMGGPLLAIVNKCKVQEMSIKINENMAIVKAGRFRAGISCMDNVDLPIIREINSDEWIKIPKGFFEAARRCLPYASKDSSMSELCSVYITEKGLCCCDNYRLAHFTFKRRLKIDDGIIIPSRSMGNICKFSDTANLKYMLVSDAWVHFWDGIDSGPVVSCRRYFGDYPDISPFLDMEMTEDTFELPEELMKALDRVTIFVDNEVSDDNYAHLECDGNTILVSCQSPSGWMKERIECAEDMKPFDIKCNPYFLKTLLSDAKKFCTNDRFLLSINRQFRFCVARIA